MNKYFLRIELKILKSFSTSSIHSSEIPKDEEKIISQTSDQDQTTDNQKNNSQFQKVNIKLLSKLLRKKIDYSQKYTLNNFLTTTRACNEYLLKPT